METPQIHFKQLPKQPPRLKKESQWVDSDQNTIFALSSINKVHNIHKNNSILQFLELIYLFKLKVT